MPSMRINLPRAGFNSISSNFLQLWHYLFDNVAFDIYGVKVLLEIRVGELVSRLKLAIVITLLLHGIISEMNKPISNVFQIEVFATCPKVALIVPITLEVAIDSSQQSIAPNIKFPVFVEKRLLYVFLNDVGPLLPIHISV